MLSQQTYNFLIYLALALVPSFISLILYLSPKKESKLNSEKYRTVLLEHLFYSSLILTIGGWASFFTQDFIYITIAFFIGGLNFLKDLFQYVFKIRGIINKNSRMEEIIIDNYETIINIYQRTSSFEEFQKTIKTRYNLSNEVIFNLYNSFKNFEQDQSNKSKTEDKSDLNYAYKLLGLSKNAKLSDVRKSFKEKARLLHPDFTQNKDDTKFKEVNEAYQLILKNIS